MAGTFEVETLNCTNMVPTNTPTSDKLLVNTKTNSSLPSNPSVGHMVYNTDLNRAQVWTGSAWKTLGLRLTFPVWTDATKPSTSGLPNGYAGYNQDLEVLQVWNANTNAWQPE